MNVVQVVIKNLVLPNSPWFWGFWGIVALIILFASQHYATALFVLILVIGVACFFFNIRSNYPSNGIWIACGICVLAVIILGVFFVSREWQPQVVQAIPTPLPTKTPLAR
jgi:hypothetical protein